MLSREQRSQIVEAGLGVQGEIDKPWLPIWGDLIEEERAAGIVSDAQWRLYAHQAVLTYLKLIVPDTIHRGEKVAWSLRTSGSRAGQQGPLWAYDRFVALAIDGVEVVKFSYPAYGGSQLWTCTESQREASFGLALPEVEKVIETLNDGLHVGEMRIEVIVTDGQLPEPKVPRNDNELKEFEQVVKDNWAEKTAAATGHPVLAKVEVGHPIKFELLGATRRQMGKALESERQTVR